MPIPPLSNGSHPSFRSRPASPPAASGDDILFGRFGLRAGWGILLYLLLYGFFYIVVPVLTQAILTGPAPSATPAQIHVSPETSSTAQPPRRELDAPVYLLDGSLLFAGLVLSSLALARLEGRRVGVYGIALRRLRDFLPGAFWGVACLSLLVAALRAAHLLVFDARVLAGRAIFFSGAIWLAVFFVVGLSEEYLFRGYLQFTLTRGLFGLGESISSASSVSFPSSASPARARRTAFWIAAMLMSAGFGLMHLLNSGETGFGAVSVFLAGLVFSYALWRTGSLWWAIGFHMTWDWAQSFLYGVPDSGALSAGRLFHTHPAGNPLLSGGTVGPEGSLLLIPAVLLIALIIRFTTRSGTQPPLEPVFMLDDDPQR